MITSIVCRPVLFTSSVGNYYLLRKVSFTPSLTPHCRQAQRVAAVLKMALGAIKTQLAELQASVESRDLAALAATRLQAGNVWQGLSPVLDAYVKSLGGDVSGNSSVAGGGGGGDTTGAGVAVGGSLGGDSEVGLAGRWWDGEMDDEAPVVLFFYFFPGVWWRTPRPV